jgi:hypothetical protein
MRWFVNVLLWLVLTAEIEGLTFEGHWTTFYTPLSTLLFRPVAHVIPWDALVVIAWGVSLSTRRSSVPAVGRSIAICAGALVVTWIWGVLHGGSTYQAVFQLHSFVMSLFVASTVANVYRTRADILSLGRTVAFACIYRSLVCFAFWFFVAKDMKNPPISMTDHTDTVLFVVGLLMFIVNAIERRETRATVFALLAAIPIIAAIVVNNRRLAWLAVAIAFVLMYLLIPAGKLKSRINRYGLIASPLVVAYIAVGWGNPTGVFKPVGSISTMFGEHQDTSSLMRDIENYNLMVTLKSSPLLGVGWGAEYIEVLRAIDISSIFPQYRYMPHNSLLGVIAFTGMFGFAGVWQLVLVCVYLHLLVYRGTTQTLARIASMTSLIAVLVIQLEMWGDVGFNHPAVCSMLAIAFGISARLPVITGLWSPAKSPPAAATQDTRLGVTSGA